MGRRSNTGTIGDRLGPEIAAHLAAIAVTPREAGEGLRESLGSLLADAARLEHLHRQSRFGNTARVFAAQLIDHELGLDADRAVDAFIETLDYDDAPPGRHLAIQGEGPRLADSAQERAAARMDARERLTNAVAPTVVNAPPGLMFVYRLVEAHSQDGALNREVLTEAVRMWGTDVETVDNRFYTAWEASPQVRAHLEPGAKRPRSQRVVEITPEMDAAWLAEAATFADPEAALPVPIDKMIAIHGLASAWLARLEAGGRAFVIVEPDEPCIGGATFDPAAVCHEPLGYQPDTSPSTLAASAITSTSDEARQSAPAWVKSAEIKLARAERDEAAARGKSSAAERPGRDAFARRERLYYIDAETSGVSDTGALARTGPVEPTPDLARLAAAAASPRMDEIEVETRRDALCDERGITVSDLLNTRRRERRLSSARRDFAVTLSREGASSASIASSLNMDPGRLSRILKDAGITVSR